MLYAARNATANVPCRPLVPSVPNAQKGESYSLPPNPTQNPTQSIPSSRLSPNRTDHTMQTQTPSLCMHQSTHKRPYLHILRPNAQPMPFIQMQRKLQPPRLSEPRPHTTCHGSLYRRLRPCQPLLRLPRPCARTLAIRGLPDSHLLCSRS